MEIRIDFVQWLQVEVVLMIFGYLHNPSDLIRLTAVSRLWQHFVISNKVSKQLCLQLSPHIASVVDSIYDANVGCCTFDEWKIKEREYKGYALLAQALIAPTTTDCIGEAISASSFDRFPEDIQYTLYLRDRSRSTSYHWSSKGSKNPEEPETLIYKLLTNLSVITEIKIKPYQARYQHNRPIYSAKAVRFCMGHPRSLSERDFDPWELPLQLPADDKFVWTYTSPVFPMNQESRLQEFKLPKAVLCVGGFLRIELLGRVQKEVHDDLYHIGISHVKAFGELLFQKFDIKILEPSGKFSLKYDPSFQHRRLPVSRHSIYEEYMSDDTGLEDD